MKKYYEKWKEVFKMARDKKGRKFNRIPAYTKIVGGKPIRVKSHLRSNRKDSRGKKWWGLELIKPIYMLSFYRWVYVR